MEPSRLTHLSLFSGIGGLDLAAERAGFRTVGQCEWADYPTKVLEKHWPDVPRWRDIRTLTKESFHERTGLRAVDVVSGGFPCQPFSVAGKRGGKEDDRYLWPEMLRVISEIRPTWVVGENVAGIVSMALDQVLSDLEGIGYACQAIIVPASAVDAPHRRDRCAILAHTVRVGLREDCNKPAFHEKRDDTSYREERRTKLCAAGRGGCFVPDTDSQLRDRAVVDRDEAGRDGLANGGDVSDSALIRLEEPGMCRQQEKPGVPAPDGDWWPAEPGMGRVAHGVPHRVDRLRCLGNAVVPPQFYPIFRYIAEIERRWLKVL